MLEFSKLKTEHIFFLETYLENMLCHVFRIPKSMLNKSYKIQFI